MVQQGQGDVKLKGDASSTAGEMVRLVSYSRSGAAHGHTWTGWKHLSSELRGWCNERRYKAILQDENLTLHAWQHVAAVLGT